jgi:hypothetical protein
MARRDHRNQDEFETQADLDLPDGFGELLNLLIDQGFEGMAQATQTLLNEAMKLARGQVRTGAPWRRRQFHLGKNLF